MQVLRDPLGSDQPPRGGVLTIGNFDGVHLGHREIFRQVVARARELDAPALAMTFEPHPFKVLRPRQAPRLLSTLGQRLELLAAAGLDTVLVVPFTNRLARMPADAFVRQVLVDRLGVREVRIGTNFHFGADREGDLDLLAALGPRLGFAAHGVEPVVLDGEVVSSTRVRQAVAHGSVGDAGRLLGRPVMLDGAVVRGARLGRKLGFPTLNIAVRNELYPAHGVYVTAVWVPSAGRVSASVTNIGVRPTVCESFATTVESHLLDFTADVYDEEVRLYALERLRDEKVFPSQLELVTQISRDVEATRSWFAAHPLDELELPRP